MQFLEKLWKMLENRDIKLVTKEKRKNYLKSEPNYHTKIFFTENLLEIKMKKTEILMNKPVHLGLSIPELSKTLTYEFWCNYVKPKYDDNIKFWYMIQIVSLYT